jgi:DNA-binding transcriptional LysR family regulator
MRSFDIAFLRSFVAVAETGTMRMAGAQRSRSTAAISQQMRALEATAGVPLFRRAAGKVVLSEQGQALLPYAREMIRTNDEALAALHRGVTGQVRFGMPQDFAQSALAEALAQFAAEHPLVTVEAHVERNSRIAGLFADGLLDLAVLIGKAPAPGGEEVARVPGAWLAREGFVVDRRQPLPLLLLEEPCVFREFALEALRRAGIAFRIAFTSPHVSGLWAAASAGVGLTVRMPVGLPPQVVPLPSSAGLPALPGVHLTLHRTAAASPAGERLHGIVARSLRALASPAGGAVMMPAHMPPL